MIGSKNINEYVISERLRTLKDNLLTGVKDGGCSKCWQEESVGIESKRQRDNKTYQDRFLLVFHKKELLDPNPNFSEYYVRLGNNCNLRCAICNDVVSTGWGSENKKFGLPYHKKNNIRKTDPIWQHMLDHARYIKLIEFIGGEPLFTNIPLQVDFLQKLIDLGFAKSIKLRYHSNGTKFNQELAELWPHFNEVTVWLSIDGKEKSFEYQRYPAEWSVLEQNIKKFKELSSTFTNFVLKVTCTVSVLNILELEDLLTWFRLQELEYHLNVLNTPWEYGLFGQEIGLKQKILSHAGSTSYPEIQNLLTNLLTAPSITTIVALKNKLVAMDQKRKLKYTDCLTLAKLLDS